MVRMDGDLLAKMDGDRGTCNRSEWIRRLIAAYGQPIPPDMVPAEPATEARPVNRATGKRARMNTVSEPTNLRVACMHPVNRRIGDQCGECGATVKGPKR